jgi:hypothetical protein
MGLTGKDAAATLVMAASAGIYAAFARGTDLPLIDGGRATAAVLLILGVFGGCAMGRTVGPDDRMPDYTAIMCLLGVTALVAAVAGVASGNGTAVGTLFVTTTVMWLLATVRHAFLPRPALVERAAQPPTTELATLPGAGAATLPGAGAAALPDVHRPAPAYRPASLNAAGLDAEASEGAAAFERRAQVSDLRDYGTSRRPVPAAPRSRRYGLLPW